MHKEARRVLEGVATPHEHAREICAGEIDVPSSQMHKIACKVFCKTKRKSHTGRGKAQCLPICPKETTQNVNNTHVTSPEDVMCSKHMEKRRRGRVEEIEHTAQVGEVLPPEMPGRCYMRHDGKVLKSRARGVAGGVCGGACSAGVGGRG